jgi:hypothetical protein
MKKTREIAMYILGGIILIGFFTLLYIIIFVGVPEQNKELLNITVGALIGSFTSVVGYFYGSSVGSKNKDELMGVKNEK